MAKKPVALIKLQVMAGSATPAPPVGPALGQHGLNIGEFVKQFNDMTANMEKMKVSTVIRVYESGGRRSFTIEVKQATMSTLIKKALELNKGSATPNTERVGRLSADQLKAIAEQKMPDLNAASLSAAMRIVAGTARSMGVDVDMPEAEEAA